MKHYLLWNIIVKLNENIERIATSSKKLKLSLPCFTLKLKELIIPVVKAANISEDNIRVLICRGAGGFSISPLECPNSSLYILVYKTTQPLDSWHQNGLTTCKSNIPSKLIFLTNIKIISCIFGVLMELEAIEQKVDLTLSSNEQGCFTKSSITNVAIVTQDKTLSLSEFQNILIRIILEKIIKILKSSVLIELWCIPKHNLLIAKEILILGTTYCCIGITENIMDISLVMEHQIL